MATQSTAAAYINLEPAITDPSVIGKGIAAGLAQRQAQAAAKRKQEEKLQKETFDDLKELSKLSSDFLNLKSIQGAQEMSSVMIAQGKQEYADLIREYKTAGYDRRIEIQSKIRNMSQWGLKWNDSVKAINDIITETAEGMGTEYDDVMSAPLVTSLMNAIQSGKQIGAFSKGKGVIGVGKYITVEDIGNGALNLSFKNEKGDVIFDGSIDEIAGKIAQSRTAFIDSDTELFDNFAKGQAANITERLTEFDDFYKITQGTDKDTTIERFRKQFKNKYGKFDKDNNPTNKFIQKEIRSYTGQPLDEIVDDYIEEQTIGMSESDAKKERNRLKKKITSVYDLIEEEAVTNAWERTKQISKLRLSQKFDWKSRGKIEKTGNLVNRLSDFMTGRTPAMGTIKPDTSWRDPEAEAKGAKNVKYKDATRYGNTMAVEVVSGKKPMTLYYDLGDEKERRTLSNLAGTAIAKSLGVADADIYDVSDELDRIFPDLKASSDSDFWITAENSINEAFEELDKLDDLTSKNVRQVLIPVHALLREKGYEIKYRGDAKLEILDRDDNSAVWVNTYFAPKKFKRQVQENIRKLLGYSETDDSLKPTTEKSTPETDVEYIIGNTTMTRTQLTNKGYSDAQIDKFIKEGKIKQK